MSTTSRTASKAADEFSKLLAAARGGCVRSLGIMLEGSRRYLLVAANRALESTLRVKEGASDLVQEVHVCAYRDFARFRGTTPAEFSAWLNRILERRVQMQVRRYRRTQRRSVGLEVAIDQVPDANARALVARGSGPSEVVAAEDEIRRVQDAMQRLPHVYQYILDQRTWRRRSFSEIAEEIGRSPGAAEKLWARAFLRLKAELTGARR